MPLAPVISGDIVDRLTAHHPKMIDLSLGRIERLLAALDHPERRMPGSVHVAGTNGKGSVVAYLRAFFEAAGLKVHAYTSPHLVKFNERIRVAGELIDDDMLLSLLDECEAVNGAEPITFFEITTALAMEAFARVPADIVLLETGLGGRLDATNVLERPLLSAITPVSADHAKFLGDTIAQIAGEKAGIFKPGVTAVLGPQPTAAADVFAAQAIALGAPLKRAGHEWNIARNGAGMVWRGGTTRLELPLPALEGAHQIVNAGIAIACAEELSRHPDCAFELSADAIARGLQSVEWPARLQRLDCGPLAGMLPQGDGWELWLDGGHNPAAGMALAGMAETWADKPLHLVLGMLQSKDPGRFLEPLAPVIDSVHGIPIPGDKSCFKGADIAAIAAGLGIASAPGAHVADAVAQLLKANNRAARILICGSLHLAGAVLAENG